MRVRLSWLVLPVFVLVVLPAPARPAADKAKPPTLVVRFKSLEALMADAKYLAGLTGQEGKYLVGEGYVNSLLGDKWTQAIDIKRPLGLYSDASLDVMAVVPVAD